MAYSNLHEEQQKLHFLLVPLMSQSHIIPLTDFGIQLAHRGVIVTIITTPLNAIRYKPIIDRAKRCNLEIQLVAIQFPSKEAGLPEGCENMDSLTSLDMGYKFVEANKLMKEPLETLMEELVPRPSCIVSTNALPWTDDVAWKFKIPRYLFQTISCFTLVCSHKISSSKIYETIASDIDSILVPDMPHKIELRRSQFPNWLKDSNDKKHVLNRLKDTEHPARGVLVNSFEEMEPSYFEEYKKQETNVWGIGSASLCNKQSLEKFDRGNKASIAEYDCLKWLDSMQPSSVIYVCFGSLSQIPSTQLIEIGLGLEASTRPFIWILRKTDHLAELETWLEFENFEHRVKERGLIIRGWAPQVVILSHPSVGGFLTHCGWNSTLEGVCAGVPMITWPLFAEQFLNEKFVVNVLRIGVSIGVEIGLMSKKLEGLVKSEKVKEAIENLMDGEEADERRKRAKELWKMGNKAIEEGGSSYLNITMFIQDVVMQQVHHNV